jgi:uncharacterized membrane protein
MNMADDVGTFWKPYLDDAIHPVFHEHPPLVFWIQSIFFRIFGDGLYLETFYGALVGLIIMGCMALFWCRVRGDFQLPALGTWWPMLLIVSLPIYTYIMQTNRLVCTYTILAILPTYASYRSMTDDRRPEHGPFQPVVRGIYLFGIYGQGTGGFFHICGAGHRLDRIQSKIIPSRFQHPADSGRFRTGFIGNLFVIPRESGFLERFLESPGRVQPEKRTGGRGHPLVSGRTLGC